jgi:hypothetical protein
MRPTVAGSFRVKVRQVIGRNSIFHKKCCTTDIFEQYGSKEIKVILELAGGGIKVKELLQLRRFPDS